MAHELDDYRDEIDALIGPIEQIVADLDALELKLGKITIGSEDASGRPCRIPASWITEQVRAGLVAAMETLGNTVGDIDNWEEPEPEPEEEDEPEVEDDDDDDTDDEED